MKNRAFVPQFPKTRIVELVCPWISHLASASTDTSYWVPFHIKSSIPPSCAAIPRTKSPSYSQPFLNDMVTVKQAVITIVPSTWVRQGFQATGEFPLRQKNNEWLPHRFHQIIQKYSRLAILIFCFCRGIIFWCFCFSFFSCVTGRFM